VRAGIGKMRRVRRVGPVPEIAVPTETIAPAVEVPVQRAEFAEVVEEALVEIPAKPELTVIPSAPAAPKIVKPRKRRPAAAKPRRKERAGRKRRRRKKAES